MERAMQKLHGMLGLAAAVGLVWGAMTMLGDQDGPDRTSRSYQAAHADETVPALALTEDADNGRSIVLPVGATLTITLQGNPATGYQWAIVDPLPPNLTVISAGTVPPAEHAKSIVGAPGQWRAILKADRPGEGTVLMTYRRAWEKTTAAAKTFKVTVRTD